MNYEKAYKEALANARQEYTTTENVERKQWLEELFPELKKSEDERIRRNIIAALKGEGYFDCDLTNECIAWVEKQGSQQPTIIWHSVSEEPEEMKELFCEWESDDATWHDVAFYDEESKTFRHAKMPINVTKWVYVDELLERQGEQKVSVADFNAKDWYVSKVDGKIHDMTYNPADKVEPKFKVRYAGGEYNVLEVKDIAGVTFYGIEDEPNHIDYVKADNCEIISGYGIKENGSPYPTKPSMFSEQKPAWSEEDKDFMYDTLSNLTELKDRYGEGYGNVGKCINWLKSIKDRVQPKPKEWSEEDERICQCLIKDQEESLDEVRNDKYGHSEIISDLKEMYRERINWLKSLKERIKGKED